MQGLHSLIVSKSLRDFNNKRMRRIIQRMGSNLIGKAVAGMELRGTHKRGETSSRLYTWALSLHRGGTTWLIDGVEQLLGM